MFVKHWRTQHYIYHMVDVHNYECWFRTIFLILRIATLPEVKELDFKGFFLFGENN